MDGFARAFAAESDRRGFVRGLFSAATGGIIGAPARAQGQEQPILPDGDTTNSWLPVIQGGEGSPLCRVASTCNERHYCSSGTSCRCLMSAEGVIRCGQIPGCDVPKCTSSADCAHLGEGYFCDTPHSGCCSDGELARCIAPCEDNLANCPTERLCGYNCCEPDQICVRGNCMDGAIGDFTGTWEGEIIDNAQRVGVRFVMQHVGGYLNAQMWYVDPVSKALVAAGQFTGDAGNGYLWASNEAYSVLDAGYDEDGETIVGTYTIQGQGADEGVDLETQIRLTRSAAAAAEIEFGVSYY